MNMTSNAPAIASKWSPDRTSTESAAPVRLRRATQRDIDAIHGLIESHLQSGHLLPRMRSEIAAQYRQFVVATQDGAVVGCAELVPLAVDVGEVRSLVVADHVQGAGVGRSLVSAVTDAAVRAGLRRLCAFTHQPGFFVRLGFTILPHLHVPEKVFTDCVRCPLFRSCGQQAVVLALEPPRPASGRQRIALRRIR